MLDILTQGAYKSRTDTLVNEVGGTAGWTTVLSPNREAKLFPRGCRGFISLINVYAKCTSGTYNLIVELRPNLCSAPIYTFTQAVTGAAGTIAVVVNRWWNYDSLVISLYTDNGNVYYGYYACNEFQADYFGSADAGATWLPSNAQLIIEPYIRSLTAGDIPVSGTVNNIPIPNTSSRMVQTSIIVPAGLSPTVISSVNGSGYCDQIIATVAAAASCNATIIEVVCDGNIVWGFSFAQLNTFGFTVSTPHVTLSLYGASTQCVLLLTKRFEFKRNLTIQAVNSAGTQSVSVYETVCFIS
jgi:hypothetical protein